MPGNQIPDLNWEKENTEKENTEQNARNETEKRTGPTLRSSKKKQSMKSRNELKQPPTKTKKKFAQIFFQ